MSCVTLSSFEDVRQAYRQRNLKQSLYDSAGLVMNDTLIVLHGDDHRKRRRLENRLFRRDVFEQYENDFMPPAISEALDAAQVEGKCDFVLTARRIVINLTAQAAGVDQSEGTPEQTERLFQQAVKFSEGATVVHSTRDPDELNVEVQEAIDAWDEEFFGPSLARRQHLLEQLEAGEIAEEELPPDLMMVLVRNQDDLQLEREVILREVGFYMLAGMHSTAAASVHAVHETFEWQKSTGTSSQDLLDDKALLQACVHESMRLHPASPVARREAVGPVDLPGGVSLSLGDTVELDLMTANRDTEVFGSDASEFSPRRSRPENVEPWGHSFGGGIHKCIGMELDGGIPPDTDDDSILLLGTVGLMLEDLLKRGARQDPEDPPTQDSTTTRKWWGRYPLIFDD